MMIHAPSAAFVIATITSTTPVTTAPKPLITALDLHPPSPLRGFGATGPPSAVLTWPSLRQ
jgi:hypothetical protein